MTERPPLEHAIGPVEDYIGANYPRGSYGFCVRCICGWTSDEAPDRQSAAQRGRLHLHQVLQLTPVLSQIYRALAFNCWNEGWTARAHHTAPSVTIADMREMAEAAIAFQWTNLNRKKD